MLKGGHFDATILLEVPPEVEIVDGLVYVTDRIGGLVIRRCFRPSTFLKSVRKFQQLANEFMAATEKRVAAFPDSGMRA